MKPYYPVDMKWPIFQHFMENPQNYPKRGGHPGIDFATPTGSPIWAVWDGKIVLSEYRAAGGYGREINLVINNTWKIVYGHESELLLRAGDIVKRGQLIGYSGGDPSDKYCGNSKGEHTHFEVRDLRKPQTYPLIGAVDPEIWLQTDIDGNTEQTTQVIESNEPVSSSAKVRVAKRCHLRRGPKVDGANDLGVMPIGMEFNPTGRTVDSDGYNWTIVECFIETGSLK